MPERVKQMAEKNTKENAESIGRDLENPKHKDPE